MSYLNEIASLTNGKKLESNYHPAGDYPCTVTGIEKKRTDNGKDLFEIHVKTTEGKSKYTLWQIEEKTVRHAQRGDETSLNQILRTQQNARDLYTNAGVLTPQQADSTEWPDLIAHLGQLVGQSYELSIQKGNRPETKDKTFVFMNKLKPGQIPPNVPQVSHQQPVAQAPAQAPQQPAYQQPAYQQPAYQQPMQAQPAAMPAAAPGGFAPPPMPQNQAGANPDLSTIPF